MAETRGILTQARDILEGNIRDWLTKQEDPVKAAALRLVRLDQQLEQLANETNAVCTDHKMAVKRVKSFEDRITELTEKIGKALDVNNDEDAKILIARKQAAQSDLEDAKALVAKTEPTVKMVTDLYNKLVTDREECRKAANAIKATATAAKALETSGKLIDKMNGISGSAAMDEYQEQADRRLTQAQTAVELKTGRDFGTEDVERKYAGSTAQSVDDELAALKAARAVSKE